MIDELALALQSWPVAVSLRNSVWVYPVVNTGHLLGIALLLGSVIAMDLRLLGIWSGVAVQPLVRVLRSTAAAGLLLAAAMGFGLFIARAQEYVVNGLFQIKLGLILCALLNIWLLRRTDAWQALASTPSSTRSGRKAGTAPVSPRVKLAALFSLLLWLSVLFFGRLIGYR